MPEIIYPPGYEPHHLLCPLSDLHHSQIAQAIHVAKHYGETAAIGNARNLVGDRSKEVFAGSEDYWTSVVLPLRNAGIASEEQIDTWAREFRDSQTLRDPRVQSFCAAWSETAALIAQTVEMRRGVVERLISERGYRSKHPLAVESIFNSGAPIFAKGSRRFLAMLHEEALSVAEDNFAEDLHNHEPDCIAKSCLLPEDAQYIIEELQSFGPEANEALRALIESFDDFTEEHLHDPDELIYYLFDCDPPDEVELIAGSDVLIFTWKTSTRRPRP